MSYTGPACKNDQHGSCPGFWAAKFGGGGRGTTCACSCHGNSGRCLWPSCSRPLPCPVHSTPMFGASAAPTSFSPLPPDYVHTAGAPPSRGGDDWGGGSAYADPRPARDRYDEPDRWRGRVSRPPVEDHADDEDDGDLDDAEFPIEGYDDLRVSQIMTLLGELDVDQLDLVWNHEERRHQRVTVLRAIDRRIAALEGGGAAVEAEEIENPYEDYYDDDEDAAEDDAEPLSGALADYHRMSVFQIIDMLGDLDDDDLMAVAQLEEQGRDRFAILGRVHALLEERGWVEVDEVDEDGEDGEDYELYEDEEPPEAVAEFPIADYDGLRVKEIVAALDGLDVDALGWVREREAGGRRRPTVLRAVDRLLIERQAAEPGEDEAEEEDEEPEADVVATEAEAGDEPTPTRTEFPIADYDRLTVFQVLRLLPDLDDEQLVAVADREEQGRARFAILERVDVILAERGHEVAGDGGAADGGAADEAVETRPAGVEGEPGPREPGPREPGRRDGGFPVAGYDRLGVKAVVARLDDLGLEDLEQVREREAGGRSRATVLRALDRLMAERRADAAALAALVAAGPAGAEAEPAPPEAGAATGGGPAAADVESPIDDYDQLSVFQILRLLPDLDDDELEAVASMEERSRNRAVILDRIDALLEA